MSIATRFRPAKSANLWLTQPQPPAHNELIARAKWGAPGRRNATMYLSRRRLLAAASVAALPVWAPRLASGDEPVASNPIKPAADSKPWVEFTAQSERAVQRGDEWLVKTMHRDGGCGVDIGQPTDIGCTCMAGLSLMAQGNTPVEGPRSREVQRIVSFIVRATENMPSDDITSQMGTQLQNKIGRHAHSFFAATFLAEVIGEGWDTEPVRTALKRVIA